MKSSFRSHKFINGRINNVDHKKTVNSENNSKTSCLDKYKMLPQPLSLSSSFPCAIREDEYTLVI